MKRCIIYARIGGPASEVNNSLMQAQLAGTPRNRKRPWLGGRSRAPRF